MADSVNSLKVNSAKGRSSRNLSFDHVSTIDFNVVKPMGVFEMVPGDHLNINPEVWLRTQAMNVPTFGKMDVITRAFFVPLRLTWKRFNDFYRSAPVNEFQAHILSYFTEVPHATMHALSMEFERRFKVLDSTSAFNNYHGDIENMEGLAQRLYYGAQCQVSSSSDVTSFQFSYRSAAALFVHKFNPIGKRVFDLFNSLGYRWQFFSPDNPTESNKGTEENFYDVSLLPLLGWLKMFKDWYCPSEYKFLFTENLWDARPSVDPYFIQVLFDELTWAVFIYFNDDIFSMCEQAPYRKGNATGQNLLNLSQIDSEPNSLLSRVLEWHKNTVTTDQNLGGRINNFGSKTEDGYNYLTNNGVNVGGAVANTTTSRKGLNTLGYSSDYGDKVQIPFNELVSNWSVMAVMRAAQWLQRNNLLSSRVTEYLKAKFGVTPTAARLDIAEYIGHAGSPVRISDIAGTGDDNLAQLGAKGTSYTIDNLEYTAEEFGYFFFTVELRPRIGYGQGVDPLVLRTHLHEFYNQEFDSLGFEPVPTETLVSGPLQYNSRAQRNHETMNNAAIDNRIFGYLPRMWSYKCKHDNLSGDFMLPSQAYDGDLQSYHLMRTIDGENLEDFVHNSLSFRYAGLSCKENNYGRIFKQGSTPTYAGIFDSFQLICSFEAWCNGLPLAMSESWQVNADHDERDGHLTNIQGSL